jgi:hypothetical protein
LTDWATFAARNNAEWCNIVCPGAWAARVWSSPTRTAPLYPDAVTLDREASEAEVLAGIDTSPGCSVKDSFSTLDLTPPGFRVLFDAEWIHRPPAPPADETKLHWQVVRHAHWVEPRVAADPSVTVLGGYRGDTLEAGAILNGDDAVIGMSNVFTSDPTNDEGWNACVQYVHATFPSASIVGYESEPVSGFRPVGPLRVWLRP